MHAVAQVIEHIGATRLLLNTTMRHWRPLVAMGATHPLVTATHVRPLVTTMLATHVATPMLWVHHLLLVVVHHLATTAPTPTFVVVVHSVANGER